MLATEFAPVEAALAAIEKGASPESFKSHVLDFVEDPTVNPQSQDPDAGLVDLLVDQVICFSNSNAGASYLVLGVDDQKWGPGAFTGTERLADWLVEKIYRNTEPHVQVETIETERCGTRLVALRIPRGMALYQDTRGRAGKRVGTSRFPLNETERRLVAMSRSNPDLTATASRRGPEDLDPTAVEEARGLLTLRRRALGDTSPIPQTGLDLCSELGLLTCDGALTFAAEVLFMRPPYQRASVRHLLRSVPGGAPTVTEISAPLVTALQQVRAQVAVHASQDIARVRLPDGQELATPAFPDTAVDEILSNAFAHRDWGAAAPVVVDQSPVSLTVRSPGGLPAGIHEETILGGTSIPRNPTLMAALHQLGLAEFSARGFDRMRASMLASGRQAPTLHAENAFVEVTLPSGSVDDEFVNALARLREAFGNAIFDSADGLAVARHLENNRILTTSTAARLMQVPEAQARAMLEWYASVGFLEQLRDAQMNYAPEWVLSARARAAFDPQEPAPAPEATTEEWIAAQLREGKELNAREVANELGVERERVSRILRDLRDAGEARITPDSATRGPNVRWVAA